jgi:magnesium-transporting ATPase (P-type)
MYNKVSSMLIISNTQNIYKNLRQANYIFSNKTRTLIKNTIRFRKINIAGIFLVYGLGPVIPIKKKNLQSINKYNPYGITILIIIEHKTTDIIISSKDGFLFPAIRKLLNIPEIRTFRVKI